MGQGIGWHHQAVCVGDPGTDLIDGDAAGAELLGEGHAELLHRTLIPVLQTLCAWGQLYVER